MRYSDSTEEYIYVSLPLPAIHAERGEGYVGLIGDVSGYNKSKTNIVVPYYGSGPRYRNICMRPLFLKKSSIPSEGVIGASSWASGADQSLKGLKQLGGPPVPQAVWDSLEKHIEIRQRQYVT